jgi:hypothetical protein
MNEWIDGIGGIRGVGCLHENKKAAGFERTSSFLDLMCEKPRLSGNCNGGASMEAS